MKVEIWSDVVCPFCYIGKYKFEQALSIFGHKDKVEVIWKSFQLNPNLKPKPGQNFYNYMAEHKGWSKEQTQNATSHVNNMAEETGLQFNFDRSIPANTFNAHRLIHLAAKHGLQDTAEELLFKAHFVDGKDLGDQETLIKLGAEIGLPEKELAQLFETNAYAGEVAADMQEAVQIGVRGVPFFVIDRKYAISGAQASHVFGNALEKAWQELNPTAAAEPGMNCSTDNNCN